MPSVLYNPPKPKPKIDEDEAKKLENENFPEPPKKKTLRQGVRQAYREFCANTSIHGFRYFSERRPKKEIIFWLVIFAIVIYFCTSIIVKIYVRWYESPVIVSFSEKSTPIWNIPFPAVTICPETKRPINKTTDDNFMHLMLKLNTFVKDNQTFDENFTQSQLEDTLTLMHVCKFGFAELLGVTKPLMKDIDYIEKLNEMLPSMDRYLYGCKWFGNDAPCDEIFSRVYTDEGICYTFNSFNAKDMYRDVVVRSKHESNQTQAKWSLEEGYEVGSNLNTYPARVLSAGSAVGLSLFLENFMEEADYTCNGPTQGFKVLLHSPDDVPSVSKHFLRITMDKEVMIAVKPNMITTTPNLAAYDPAKRLCYLNKDRQLRFYKTYSQNNCERECLTNFTLSQCGCVAFSMPRTKDMPVCGEDKLYCYKKAYSQLLMKQFNDGQVPDEPVDDCNCMPGCTSLEYDIEISEGYFDLVNTFKAFDIVSDDNDFRSNHKMSKLLIYFKENQFITSKRSELYGITELLANFGGVFGLFMGISILSIVELIYHFTLRLWSNISHTYGLN
ncbi:pickpocket protein 28-like [Haematobia irritans]|uniref:pickpocket protein 28-like n=1 Tax=Haematobia irritans TaxID=7368 RepID=UPI003F4F931F